MGTCSSMVVVHAEPNDLPESQRPDAHSHSASTGTLRSATVVVKPALWSKVKLKVVAAIHPEIVCITFPNLIPHVGLFGNTIINSDQQKHDTAAEEEKDEGERRDIDGRKPSRLPSPPQRIQALSSAAEHRLLEMIDALTDAFKDVLRGVQGVHVFARKGERVCRPSVLLTSLPTAIPILCDDAGDAIAALALYGSGRVVAFGHESFLVNTLDPSQHASTPPGQLHTLIQNTIHWATEHSHNKRPRVLCYMAGTRRPFNISYSCQVASSTKLERLDEYDLVIVRHDDVTIERIAPLVNFVAGGGSLFVAGSTAHWRSTHGAASSSLAVNCLTAHFGIVFSHRFAHFKTTFPMTSYSVSPCDVNLNISDTFTTIHSMCLTLETHLQGVQDGRSVATDTSPKRSSVTSIATPCGTPASTSLRHTQVKAGSETQQEGFDLATHTRPLRSGADVLSSWPSTTTLHLPIDMDVPVPPFPVKERDIHARYQCMYLQLSTLSNQNSKEPSSTSSCNFSAVHTIKVESRQQHLASTSAYCRAKHPVVVSVPGQWPTWLSVQVGCQSDELWFAGERIVTPCARAVQQEQLQQTLKEQHSQDVVHSQMWPLSQDDQDLDHGLRSHLVVPSDLASSAPSLEQTLASSTTSSSSLVSSNSVGELHPSTSSAALVNGQSKQKNDVSWQRWPSVISRYGMLKAKYDVEQNRSTVEFTPHHDGILYLAVALAPDTNGMSIPVSVKAPDTLPTFLCRHSNQAEWQMLLKESNAPWAEAVGTFVIFTAPLKIFQQVKSMEEALATWDALVGAMQHLRGESPLSSLTVRIVADVQTLAGDIHAGYPLVVTEQLLLDCLVHEKPSAVHCLLHHISHNLQNKNWLVPLHVESFCDVFVTFALASTNSPLPDTSLLKQRATAHILSAHNGSVPEDPFTVFTLYVLLVSDFGWNPFIQTFAAYMKQDIVCIDPQDIRDTFVQLLSFLAGASLDVAFRMWGVHSQASQPMMMTTRLPLWLPSSKAMECNLALSQIEQQTLMDFLSRATSERQLSSSFSSLKRVDKLRRQTGMQTQRVESSASPVSATTDTSS
eukprot:m.259383 g.259383  ORF g.259383 m.259383 type:complete len:1069 (-) comp15553_c0_seq1:79-3285(-)